MIDFMRICSALEGAEPVATVATGCTKPARERRETAGLNLTRHESSAIYSRVIASCPTYRVILCKDAIQWIIQRRVKHAGSRSGARWKAVSYHTERRSLIRVWHARTRLPLPMEIRMLPEKITRN